MMTEEEILYSGKSKTFWVCKAKHGYEVYRNKLTHAERCAVIGYEGQEGLRRAIQECERREEALAAKNK